MRLTKYRKGTRMALDIREEIPIGSFSISA
jgi:hypothetical protein